VISEVRFSKHGIHGGVIGSLGELIQEVIASKIGSLLDGVLLFRMSEKANNL